eukprot:g553.t1
MMGDVGCRRRARDAPLPDAIDVSLRRLRRAPHENAKSLLTRLREDPELSRRRSGTTGRLPLHEAVLAVSRKTPPKDREPIVSVLRLLLDQFPEAANAPDPVGVGWYPLHRALKAGGVGEEVFSALLGLANKPLDSGNQLELLNLPDPEGALPLVRAIRTRDTPESLVRLLIQRGGASTIMHQDCNIKQGWNALHFAARHHAPIGVVESMLNVAGESAKAKDRLGVTPLHVAVSSKAGLGIVRLLMSYSDRGVEDKLKRTPLSIAIRIGRDNPKGVLEELLANAAPEELRKSAADKFVLSNTALPEGRHYSSLRAVNFVRGSKLGACNT